MFVMGVCRLLGRLVGGLWNVPVCVSWVCGGCLGYWPHEATEAQQAPGRPIETQRTTTGTRTEMLVHGFGSLFDRLSLFLNCPLF